MKYLLIAAIVTLLGDTAYAAPPAVAQSFDLRKIEVVNGEVFPLKLSDLREWAPVARAIAPNATYALRDGTLRVSADVAGIRKGVVLTEIQFKDDCPTNSTFREQSFLAGDEKRIDAAVLAWTRRRHNTQAAPRYIRHTHGAVDVTLNIKPHGNSVSAR